MRFSRLISATALVAAVTLLASCGESSSPTTASANDPGLSLGPREYNMTPNPTGWTKQPADPIPTDTRTVLIAGLIAAASYPQFGTPVYSAGGNGWLTMNLTPNFSLSPLGWRVTFKLNPSAQSLPIGTYNVKIPVMVPGATTNPQTLTVTFSNCGNCIFLGDSKPGSLDASSPRWNRGNDLFAAGNYAYQDWRLFVDPGQSVYVQQIGGSYVICSETGPLGSQADPVVYAFTTADAFVSANDDYCGYSSQIGPFTNGGATRIEYHIRATQFCDVFCDSPGYNSNGTYTIRVVTIPFGGGDVREQADSAVTAANAAKKHHSGN